MVKTQCTQIQKNFKESLLKVIPKFIKKILIKEYEVEIKTTIQQF